MTLRLPGLKLYRSKKLVLESQLFDESFYRNRTPGADSCGDPLEHYLVNGNGATSSPHPLFDAAWYVKQNPLDKALLPNPLLHYITIGWKEGRSPHALFDIEYYFERNPELRRSNCEPLLHYLRHGASEGRDPHPLFDTDFYLAANPDVASAGLNPLVHYVMHGSKEGRRASRFFDDAFYLNSYPEVANSVDTCLQHYLAEGALQGKNPSATFDTKWYIEQNSDVRAAGHNPLVHYVRCGLAEGRWPNSEFLERRSFAIGKTQLPRIVFISGEPDTPGHHYRVTNLAGSLPPRGFETLVMDVAQAHNRTDEIERADLIWIWRTAVSADTPKIISAARHARAAILFDVDDLMFRPELAVTELIDGIRTQGMTEADVSSFYRGIQGMLLKADRCTAPTVPLAREIRQITGTATVIPNGFDSKAFLQSRAAARLRKSKSRDGKIRIGYASGTFTHQKDFSVAAKALLEVMREHSHVRLVLYRDTLELAEFPGFEEVTEQVEWCNRVPLEQLPYEYSRFDISIAPLQTGNRYCEAKSELKFFEAALVGVPTLASPTQPFAGAILHDKTGLLARNDTEWHQSLTRLIHDETLRRHLAEQALHDVLWLYGPERRSQLATQLVNEMLAPASLRNGLYRPWMHAESPSRIPRAAVPEYHVLFQSRTRGDSRVSVIMPLFNYAHLVLEALNSVLKQTVRGIDVVVVDDGSRDGSVEVAMHWLKQHASEFNQVALLQNRVNSGLGRTRNAGVSFCDTELFFPLDPDNSLAPDCLEKCAAALDHSGAAFAYPNIELFGDRTGALDTPPYDPALFQRANYIDAMALVRKACWIAVGGYSPLEPMGWEDYDFWCKLAEKGLYGVHVPNTAAWYRSHPDSMLRTITDRREVKPRVVADMNARHPWLQLSAEFSDSAEQADTLAATTGNASAEHAQGLDRLIEILQCPETKERLIAKDAETLVSEGTGRCWPIVKGRPVFTPEGTRIAVHAETHLSNELAENARRLIEDTRGLILNLSAGGTRKKFPHVVELEYALFRNTDVAGDALRLPFRDNVFEAVLCMNAIEHYKQPETALEEIRRVLRPGGRLLIQTAFMQPLHEAPNHYYNCTEYGLQHWLRCFRIEYIRVPPNMHVGYSLSWIASEAEYALREVSEEAAERFGATRISQLAGFWRERDLNKGCELSVDFNTLPASAQHHFAAGWEALCRKV